MISKRIYIKKNRIVISLFLVVFGITLILTSELSRFIGISNSLLIDGMTKTFVYVMIFFGFIIALTKKHSKIELSGYLLATFTIIMCISTFLGVTPDIPIWRQIIHLTLFLSSFYVIYIAVEQLTIDDCVGIIVMSYLIIASFYFIAILENKSLSGNVVYYLLVYLPLTPMIKLTILKRGLYVFQFIVILLSNKRTALIAFVAYCLSYEWMTDKNISLKKRIYKGALYIMILVILYIIFPIICEKLHITVFNELELSHITEDGGSNRLYIYNQLWQTQKISSIKHWLIGSGYNSVLLSKVCTDGFLGASVSAHNDFLEVLYDYGVIGISIYVTFFLSLINKGINMVRDQYKYGKSFISSILIVIFTSLTSHLIIYLNYYAIIFCFWALCLADYRYGDKYE